MPCGYGPPTDMVPGPAVGGPFVNGPYGVNPRFPVGADNIRPQTRYRILQETGG